MHTKYSPQTETARGTQHQKPRRLIPINPDSSDLAIPAKRVSERMKLQRASVLKATALAIALASPLMASAESDLTIGSGSATARLNFSVVIPRVLFLGVGTGATGFADNGTIDTLTYNVAATDVGSGTDTATQGVAVRVLGNSGQITIAAAGSGTGLSNGTDTIPWTEILATSSDATNLDVPAAGGTSAPLLNGTKWTDRSATWNYAYSNSTLAAPGTYTGQMTYTATTP